MTPETFVLAGHLGSFLETVSVERSTKIDEHTATTISYTRMPKISAHRGCRGCISGRIQEVKDVCSTIGNP